MLRKSASVLFAFVLAFALCPITAFAADYTGGSVSIAEEAAGTTTETGSTESGSTSEAGASDNEDSSEDENASDAEEDGDADLFGNDLTPPTGLLPESVVELPSSGILRGWGDYLYYLVETPASDDGTNFAFHAFMRYNVKTDTWQTLDSLPEWLTMCSADFWEGNLVVTGVAYDAEEGTTTAEERVFLYNVDDKAWVRITSEDVPLGASIANLNGTLVLAGGASTDWEFGDSVLTYSTETGVGDEIGTLEQAALNPQLAVHMGALYVYSYGNTLEEWNTADAERHLQKVSGGSVESLDDALPDFLEAATLGETPARASQFGSLVATVEGLMIVGATSDSDSTDTYQFEWDDGTVFLGYHERLSDDRTFAPAACIHGDLVYACAASLEDGKDNMVFRAADVFPAVPKSGNYSVWVQGSSTGLRISFTPDYVRYNTDHLTIDGKDVYTGHEYDVSSGSTVIDLRQAYLSTLALGRHEMVAYFDGDGTPVPAYFTIERAVSPTPHTDGPSPSSGGGNPTSLAQTSDSLPLAPLTAVAAVALCATLLALRERRLDD